MEPNAMAQIESHTPMPLRSLAQVVRSKNAGPTMLTLDLFMNDAQAYERAMVSAALQPDAVAALYGVAPTEVQRYLLPELHAIKFSLPRALCAGTPGDGDVYGAQQHGPLLEVML
jgi:hypothetical protein